jgi:putative peptide zinc metalloprotease protein
VTTVVAAPARAPGVELLGALEGSGYRETQHLVRRQDGQTVQLTSLLYDLLDLADGSRDLVGLADGLSERLGKRVAPEDVAELLQRLRPLGLLAGAEASQVRKRQPLLGLSFRFVISDPRSTRRVTGPFVWLLRPAVVVPVLAAFLGVCWFVLVDKGLASATHQAFFQPELLLLVFGITVVSAGFHELGHAAACRYGGATPGAMGAGLYLVWPAFYTDVDDSYRLSRWGRLRVDLGGLYFNVVAAVAVFGAWLVWQKDALLLGVATQLLQMVRQSAPYIRADGYHVLADLTGVPDLFRHLGPTLRRLLPWHWHEPSQLRRRARWLVTGWTLVVVPLMASMVLTGILLFPRLAATAWAGGRVQASQLDTLDPVTFGGALLRLVALVLPVLSVSLLGLRLLRRGGRSLWQATQDRPRSRAAVVLAGLVALLLVITAWWPSGQWQEVRADEATARPASGSAISGTPVRQLAMALVPKSGDGPALLVLPGADGARAILTSARDGGTAAGRSFPFTLPDAPGPGDNQALAVGDKDGTSVYDVSYAVVTVTDGAPVTSRNEAWALASCTACTTVAVAFQVVLVVGQADVIAPVNTAVAANSGCLACITTAMAVQLVATVSALPPQEVYDQLAAAMAQLHDLEGLDAQALWDAVQEVQADVTKVLTDAGLLTDVTTSGVTATASPAASSSATPSAGTSAPAAPASAPSEGVPTPTVEPTPTPSPSSSEPTPSPTATP